MADKKSVLNIDPKLRCFEVNAPADTVISVQFIRELLQDGTPEALAEVHETLDRMEQMANIEIKWLRQLGKNGDKPSIMFTEVYHQSFGRED